MHKISSALFRIIWKYLEGIRPWLSTEWKEHFKKNLQHYNRDKDVVVQTKWSLGNAVQIHNSSKCAGKSPQWSRLRGGQSIPGAVITLTCLIYCSLWSPTFTTMTKKRSTQENKVPADFKCCLCHWFWKSWSVEGWILIFEHKMLVTSKDSQQLLDFWWKRVLKALYTVVASHTTLTPLLTPQFSQGLQFR